MGDLALQFEARVEAVEREESRFEQKGAKAFYGDSDCFMFPRNIENDGTVSFNVSSTAWLYGIQTTLYISARLYARQIRDGIRNPLKNIETLCHAFMYAVSCDRENQTVLSFNVPGNRSELYKARASMRGWREKYIFLDIDE